MIGKHFFLLAKYDPCRTSRALATTIRALDVMTSHDVDCRSSIANPQGATMLSPWRALAEVCLQANGDRC